MTVWLLTGPETTGPRVFASESLAKASISRSIGYNGMWSRLANGDQRYTSGASSLTRYILREAQVEGQDTNA